LEAVESIFGGAVTVPGWVKGELAHWAAYIQNDLGGADNGGSGYTQKNDWDNIGKTGALLAEMRLIGPTATPQPSLPDALGFMDAHWGDTVDENGNPEHFNGNYYAMYGAMKGFRLMGINNLPSGLNWYQEYANFLVYDSTYGQLADGSWPGGHWFDQTLSTAGAILILSRTVVGAPFVSVECDAAKFPEIKLTVKVDTNAGNSGSLTPGNFELEEDGAMQTMKSFLFDPSTQTYIIKYMTTNPNPDGTTREVLVRVDDPVEGIGTDTCFYDAPTCGSIEGYVTDCLTGRPLDKAVIGAKQNQTTLKAVSDSEGYYKIECLRPGTWLLVCVRRCYHPWAKKVEVKPSGTVRCDFMLRPRDCGAVEENVFELLDNYPEPFNPETWIPYKLPQDLEVTIRIYSATGQMVRTMNLGLQKAGIYLDKNKAAYWDGRNDEGSQVASGVYFYTLQAGDFTATRKMMLLK
jgi:hypothetical protein